MAITMYSWTDAGAPAQPTTANVTAASWWASFLLILKGCLVTGYGSKPAAGWTIKFESAVCISLQSATADYEVIFVNPGNGRPVVWLADRVTTYPTAWNIAPVGDVVRSYLNNPDSNTAGAIHNVGFESSPGSYYRTWCCVADEYTFTLVAASNSYSAVWNSSTDATNDPTGNSWQITVGEVTHLRGLKGLARVMALGGNANVTFANFAANGWRAWFSIGTVCRDPLTGLVLQGVPTYPQSPPYITTGSATLAPITMPALPGVGFTMSKIQSTWNGVTFAHIRGVVHIMEGVGNYWAGQALKTSGLFDLYAGSVRDCFHRPFTLDDGYQYAICGYKGPCYLVTNNPEYWGRN